MKVNFDRFRHQITDTYNTLFKQLASTPLRDDTRQLLRELGQQIAVLNCVYDEDHPYCHNLSDKLTVEE